MEGWILDIYPTSDGMCVWIIDEEGRASAYIDRWAPCFYLKAEHFNSSFTGNTFYAAPDYPYRDFVIRFGLVWNFFS